MTPTFFLFLLHSTSTSNNNNQQALELKNKKVRISPSEQGIPKGSFTCLVKPLLLGTLCPGRGRAHREPRKYHFEARTCCSVLVSVEGEEGRLTRFRSSVAVPTVDKWNAFGHSCSGKFSLALVSRQLC